MTTKKAMKDEREKAEPIQRRIRNRARGSGVDLADWSAVDAEKVKRVIASVSACHCAVQFGYTRDMGAYCIRIVGDGEPYNEYIRPTEDIDLYLESLALDFEDTQIDKGGKRE